MKKSIKINRNAIKNDISAKTAIKTNTGSKPAKRDPTALTLLLEAFKVS
jgi:hypothetical protein